MFQTIKKASCLISKKAVTHQHQRSERKVPAYLLLKLNLVNYSITEDVVKKIKGAKDETT